MHHLVFLLLLCAAFPPSGAVDLQRRIYGGKDCDDEDRLYHVQVLSQDSKGKTYLCGGSLIHKQWVLTAAHCLETKTSVVLGVHPGSKKEVVEIKTNPIIYTDQNGQKHDIMLLKLPKATNLHPVVALPPVGCQKPAPGTTIQMAGHGENDKGPTPSSNLLCVDMEVKECQKIKDEVSGCLKKHNLILPNFFCTDVKGGKGTGAGDSGGGAIFDKKIYGVLSSGGGCKVLPAFMDVCSYLKWIDDEIKK